MITLGHFLSLGAMLFALSVKVWISRSLLEAAKVALSVPEDTVPVSNVEPVSVVRMVEMAVMPVWACAAR